MMNGDKVMKERACTSILLIVSLLAYVGCASRAKSDHASRVVPSTLVTSPETSTGVSVTKQQASGIYFLNEKISWALCGEAQLCGTTDGGKTWKVLNRGDLRHATELIFANERDGWAVLNESPYERRADFVLRTQDGGRTWREVLDIDSPIYGINFLNERVGYVTARWTPTYHTTDGGETWKELPAKLHPSISEGLHHVFFVSENEAWGYGGGIYHTNDGGRTWTEIVSDEEISGELYSASFVDEKTGWIVGSGREVWRTTDGRTWQRMMSVPSAADEPDAITKEMPSNLYSVSFINRNEGWLVANDKTVLHTADGGMTWQVVSRWSGGVDAVRFVNQREGWAIDNEGNLLHTTDAGRSWEVQRIT